MKKYSTVLIYSLVHFLVDFSCAFLIYRQIHNSELFYLLLLIYNFCAFALQMPFGLIADHINKNAVFAASGCILVAAAYGFGRIPLAAVLFAGIGNGLFHIGGGIDILNISTEKASALGVFVSTGAFGIYFGTMLGNRDVLSGINVILSLLAAAAVILIVCYRRRRSFTSDNLPVSFGGLPYAGILIGVVCLFSVVCLRSYVGLTMNFSWKGQGWWGLIFVCAVVFGKMCGGFLADWIGAIRASIISLGLSALLFLVSNYPPFGVIAVFLFNMTMPVTLWAVARVMKGCKGFSFGLLTFGLFIGFAPVYLGIGYASAVPLGFAAFAAVSLILLVFGLRKAAV